MPDQPKPGDPPKKTVRVKATQEHTAFGELHHIGDEYDLPEEYLISIMAQGKAVRVQNATAVVADEGQTQRKDLRAKP